MARFIDKLDAADVTFMLLISAVVFIMIVGVLGDTLASSQKRRDVLELVKAGNSVTEARCAVYGGRECDETP